jgi:hypothetical protein
MQRSQMSLRSMTPLLVLLLAFVKHQGHTNTVTAATNRRVQRSLVAQATDKMAAIFSHPKGENYTGRMLGVTCECTLHRAEKYASLSLWGVPIGGHLSGKAWFKEDGRSVVLDPELAKAIDRRLTQIFQAHYRPKDDTVHIFLSVPIFGVKRMVLHRKQSASSG